MLVQIYIEIITTGRFECCDGKYACVLEVEINGQPVSRTHYGAWTDISIQRLQLRACITAMSHITKESEIEIHINAPAIAAAFDNKTKENTGKNADLWNQFRELCEPHLVTICHEKRNICTPALRAELKNREIPAKPDKEMKQEKLK